MKMKKFLAVGILCMMTLSGCNATQTTQSNNVQESTEATVEASTGAADASAESASVSPDGTQVSKSAAAEAEASPSGDEAAMSQIKALAGFIGKSAHDVNVVLGQPSTEKHIENSKVLAANYYKVEFCNEIAKVEVDFDVDSQKVNYVSFTIMSADDIETTKNTFVSVLTSLYGESTIERYMDVKGKQRRDWKDDTLDYDLKYYENNISLDIYPLDK